MFISMFEVGDILDGLNEQQRRAATHEGGPLLVLAGAGTGKTRTLVARAAWLRDSHGLPASRILLLTFTRRAASDMLARAASAGPGCGRADLRRDVPRHRPQDHPPACGVVLAAAPVHHPRPGRCRRPDGRAAPRSRPGRPRPAVAAGGDLRRHLQPLREHRAAGQRGGHGQLPVVRPVHQPAGRPVPRLHGPQARPPPGRLRRPAAAVAGRAGRPRGRAGAARHVRCGPGRRVPGRQRGPGQHRPAAAARREAADLRGRRRAGHLRLPRRRPRTPARSWPPTTPAWMSSACTATTGPGRACWTWPTPSGRRRRAWT